MLLRTSKPFQLSHRIRYSDFDLNQTPFEQENGSSIDIVKLKKARKLLQTKEQCLANRIKVMKKQEQKMIKRKQNELKWFIKVQMAKKEVDCYKSLNKTPRKLSTKQNNFNSSKQHFNYLPNKQNNPHRTKRNTHLNTKLSLKSLHEDYQQEDHQRYKAQKLYLEKIQNAKRLKQQRQLNQVRISKQRALELNRKLQSAGMIRRNRQKVKETRQNFIRSRQQSIKTFRNQQYEKERKKLKQIQQHVADLQKQQIDALQNWKKVFQQNNCQWDVFEGLQICQAKQIVR